MPESTPTPGPHYQDEEKLTCTKSRLQSRVGFSALHTESIRDAKVVDARAHAILLDGREGGYVLQETGTHIHARIAPDT